MAKRTRKLFHDDKTREKIQASQLVNRLQSHIFTHKHDPDFEKKYMEPSQVKAAETLLRKILPDLQAQQLSQDPENPIIPVISAKPLSKEEWNEKYASDMGATEGATRSAD